METLLNSDQPDVEQLQGIRNTVTARPDLCEFSRQHAEYGGKNQCRFFWHLFKPRRAEVLRILSKLPLVATSQDAGVEQALAFVMANRHRHHEWITLTAADSARLTLANLTWIPEKWWKLVTGETQPNVAPTRINRRQFEVCFCAQMVRELKSGDVCVTGSDSGGLGSYPPPLPWPGRTACARLVGHAPFPRRQPAWSASACRRRWSSPACRAAAGQPQCGARPAP